MSPLVFVAVAFAGGLGATTRFGVDLLARRRFPDHPAGTFVINLSGSFLLAVVVSAVAATRPAGGEVVVAVLGTGFLGGYTTFSSAMVEVVELLDRRRCGGAVVHAVGMLLAAVACAGLGWWCGAQFG